MIVTIDGPAGTGKTTVARRVAERLGFHYIDTGAMYRAATWFLLEKKVPLQDDKAIARALQEFTFSIEKGPLYRVGGRDVTKELRSKEVTAAVSQVSAKSCVREPLWKLQREIGKSKNCVFEGRDMGSIVFPDAEKKFFLTARPEVRAERRFKELKATRPNDSVEFETLQKEIERRDAYDASRELAPLLCPEGAHQIDTSDRTIDQVVEEIVRLCGA